MGSLKIFFQKATGRVLDRFPTPFHLAVKKWFSVNGDHTLRFKYDLPESPVVFDVGGYEGWWTAEMLQRFPHCICYVFEPVKEFAQHIKERFLDKDGQVFPFAFGLGEATNEFPISHEADGSSFFHNAGNGSEMAQCVCITDFIHEHNITGIDVLKLNIEGAEYGLIEELIRSGDMKKVVNLQVQFHRLKGQNSRKRMHSIWKALQKTHRLTWGFRPYVWENWERKDDVAILK